MRVENLRIVSTGMYGEWRPGYEYEKMRWVNHSGRMHDRKGNRIYGTAGGKQKACVLVMHSSATVPESATQKMNPACKELRPRTVTVFPLVAILLLADNNLSSKHGSNNASMYQYGICDVRSNIFQEVRWGPATTTLPR